MTQQQNAPKRCGSCSAPIPSDEFRGDTPSLVRNIIALLAMDAEGCLVPHGVGGHARGLLSAAAARLTGSTAQAPAKGLPYEPTTDMLTAGRACDPALPADTVRAVWWAMWRTAPHATSAPFGYAGHWPGTGAAPAFYTRAMVERHGDHMRAAGQILTPLYEWPAPAAPAVDDSFEDRISDWAHGDALDADRYRTWRDNMIADTGPAFHGVVAAALPPGVGVDRRPTAEEWDAAIDAARSAQAKEGAAP